jgi:hypothetical protein
VLQLLIAPHKVTTLTHTHTLSKTLSLLHCTNVNRNLVRPSLLRVLYRNCIISVGRSFLRALFSKHASRTSTQFREAVRITNRPPGALFWDGARSQTQPALLTKPHSLWRPAYIAFPLLDAKVIKWRQDAQGREMRLVAVSVLLGLFFWNLQWMFAIYFISSLSLPEIHPPIVLCLHE